MELLRQAALILGTVASGVATYSAYRNFRTRPGILFSILALVVSIYALSLVAWLTFQDNLALGIHWIANVWIAPPALYLLNWISQTRDRFSLFLPRLAVAGAILLSLIRIALEVRPEWIERLLQFWPALILVELLNRALRRRPGSKQPQNSVVTNTQAFWIYFGVGVTLITCTRSDLLNLGDFLPALGNILASIYLVFLALTLAPQRWLRLPQLISRFLATATLALVLTLFYAFLQRHFSASVPLLILNSFLATLLVLMLWRPLTELFIAAWDFMGRTARTKRKQEIARYLEGVELATSEQEIERIFQELFRRWFRISSVELIGAGLSPELVSHLVAFVREAPLPLVHRRLIDADRGWLWGRDGDTELQMVESFLQTQQAEWLIVLRYRSEFVGLLLAKGQELDPVGVGLGLSSLSELIEVIDRAAAQLSRIRAHLADLERRRMSVIGELASGMAHEIRNPLGAIRGALDLLDPKDRWVKVIRDESDRINRLVEQVLDLARTGVETRRPISVVDLVNASLKSIAMRNPATDGRVRISGDVEIRVEVEARRIHQVLLNLIENALKATETKEDPEVSVDWSVVGTKVRIHVRDNGRGISAELADKIFEPFVSGFDHGTGLGLSISERIVREHGGTLRFESIPGTGTIFTLELTLFGGTP
jgi:two-component system, NtrC family, sensor histidine kinase HydH